ncbi:tRNA (adenosine(37)-N6)-dimethylallyltransferase MiaA [Corynebacterium sp. zg-331]|uniref:tRNA (adenosine(37)-N6)-dimethylallyltransferase MiaA n=1 Tax=unclassified Corynebacterium TaxID=2624378 RepID=UPI00128D6A7F|nr:tRNA (adenosine(37)-N6)-dimethylallyltransferase MiaA [Corynebacterium sp. zg-331]MPV51884.1 tRNA (adenosine(37)-N6)-dimethylallyltransferase MiaA [Corynebacterium sp. zg331]
MGVVSVRDRLPTPIAVVGPTASGKSALGLALAHRLGGEIVNVDSMQLYRGMDIGTAKLAMEQREGIVHHQLDVWEVTEKASVARYQRAAVADVERLLARGITPILVGGSMLYAQALLDDWQFPPTDPAVRDKWQKRLDEVGIAALHRELARRDPQAAAIIEDRDPRRTVRALEVIELTGSPYQASQPPIGAPPRWNTRIIGLGADSEWLNPCIERRTGGMFEAGLVAEVEHLVAHRGLRRDSTAGRAIGYAQVLDALDGQMSWEQAKERTTFGTRRYVRRQRSWFRRDPRIHWIDASRDTVSQALEWLG